MSFFPNRTTFLKIGPFTIQWYAILIMTGAFIAYYFSKCNLKKYRNIDVDDFFDNVFVLMMWGGLIGARLWFCVFNDFTYYFSNPIAIIRIWDGGVAFHGCFFGGALAAFLYCRHRRVSFIKFLDAVTPTVLVAQALGRWGNFINKECHGAAVSADYFDGILFFLKEGMNINGIYYKPLFFYESMLCLIGFFLINFLLRKTQQRRGELTGAYLIWYGIVRFFIEEGRTDSLYIGPLKTAQLTSILYVILGLLLYLGIHEKIFKPAKPTIIFDLDGTLQDSNPAIIGGFRATFEKYGKVEDFTPERQLEVLGPPIKEMFEKFFPDLNSDELCEYYRERSDALLETTLKANEHAIETVEALKEEGYHMAILTTRKKDSVKKCLKICGMREECFDDIVGLLEVSHTKPDPEGIFRIIKEAKLNSSDVIVIGDSIADINAAKSYGAYSVAYSVIEGKRPAILEAEPDKVISDLRELIDIVNEKHYFTYDLK